MADANFLKLWCLLQGSRGYLEVHVGVISNWVCMGWVHTITFINLMESADSAISWSQRHTTFHPVLTKWAQLWSKTPSSFQCRRRGFLSAWQTMGQALRGCSGSFSRTRAERLLFETLQNRRTFVVATAHSLVTALSRWPRLKLLRKTTRLLERVD